jgi:hypothetical protein
MTDRILEHVARLARGPREFDHRAPARSVRPYAVDEHNIRLVAHVLDFLVRSSSAPEHVRLSQLTLLESIAQLRSTANSKFGEHPVQMPTDGSVGEKQALADLTVRHPFRRELCDL